MLHHGPNHKHLVLTPCAGLGNRMLAILSALRYIELGCYKTLTICWVKHGHCPIDLSEIADILVDHDIMDSFVAGSTPQFQLVKGYKYDKIMASNIWNSQDDILESWIPWARQCKLIKWKLPEPICQPDVGIHCRRSDWGVCDFQRQLHSDSYALHSQLDQTYYDEIADNIKGKAFISSDSYETIEYFKSKRPDIISQNKSQYSNNSERSLVMMREALIDLATLAKCRVIYRDSSSTFSLLASIIGRNRLITWRRPYLDQSGTGYLGQFTI